MLMDIGHGRHDVALNLSDVRWNAIIHRRICGEYCQTFTANEALLCPRWRFSGANWYQNLDLPLA
jgi:hypothetical protein